MEDLIKADRELEALKESIDIWYKKISSPFWNPNCPLCDLHINESKEGIASPCSRCVIFRKTGLFNCHQTSFYVWQTAFFNKEELAAKQAAVEMFEFLLSLLPESEKNYSKSFLYIGGIMGNFFHLNVIEKDQLKQISKAKCVWDGDLITKIGTQRMADLGLIRRRGGFNYLTLKGKFVNWWIKK